MGCQHGVDAHTHTHLQVHTRKNASDTDQNSCHSAALASRAHFGAEQVEWRRLQVDGLRGGGTLIKSIGDAHALQMNLRIRRTIVLHFCAVKYSASSTASTRIKNDRKQDKEEHYSQLRLANA